MVAAERDRESAPGRALGYALANGGGGAEHVGRLHGQVAHIEQHARSGPVEHLPSGEIDQVAVPTAEQVAQILARGADTGRPETGPLATRAGRVVRRTKNGHGSWTDVRVVRQR